MAGASALRRQPAAADLFEQVGAVLAAQGLSPDPVNYAFAHHLLTRADPAAEASLTRLLHDGIRLTNRDIERLDGRVVAGAAPVAARESADRDQAADALVSQTRVQAEAIATVVRAMHDETRGFGRDLALTAAAAEAGQADVDHVARATRAMIARAAAAEARLSQAMEEAEQLRTALAEAQASARQDPLTGLPNRRGFEEGFAALDPAGRHCLALCDIDRFKAVNDGFGHAVGDRVLAAVARLLSGGCAGHLVTRQGGEEFAVLLADTELPAAHALLEAAREDLAQRRLRDRDSDAPIGRVTFSAGVVAIGPDEPSDAALARADRLLYRAKARGRNLVLAG